MQGSASDAGATQSLSLPATVIQLRRMARALQIFEVKPAYEDLATPGATSLQQYLKQVHEMNVLAAIQVTSLACRNRRVHWPAVFYMPSSPVASLSYSMGLRHATALILMPQYAG